MSEEEILKSDLRYIFGLVDVHIKIHNPQKGNKETKNNKAPEKEVYIDSIKF